MITPAMVCDAGLALSMGEARRQIHHGNIRWICAKCGACRCEECQERFPRCKQCDSRDIVLDKKGSCD